MLFSLIVVVMTMSPTSTPETAPDFPKELQGSWTDDLSACGKEDTGRMLITSHSVEFYEAVGVPMAVDQAKDRSLTATLKFKGEGKTWVETDRFVLAEDNQSVRVSALGRTFTLKRCGPA